jgi:hypothetical protein
LPLLLSNKINLFFSCFSNGDLVPPAQEFPIYFLKSRPKINLQAQQFQAGAGYLFAPWSGALVRLSTKIHENGGTRAGNALMPVIEVWKSKCSDQIYDVTK